MFDAIEEIRNSSFGKRLMKALDDEYYKGQDDLVKSLIKATNTMEEDGHWEKDLAVALRDLFTRIQDALKIARAMEDKEWNQNQSSQTHTTQ